MSLATLIGAVGQQGGAPPSNKPTFELLDSGLDSDNQTSYATASVSVVAGDMLLLFCTGSHASAAQPAPSVTGLGATWTSHLLSEATPKRLYLHRAVVPAETSGAVTIDFGAATMNELMWGLVRVGNCETGGTNGAELFGRAIGYASRRDANVTTTGGLSLQELADPDNATLVMLGSFKDPTMAGAGWSEVVSEGGSGGGTPDHWLTVAVHDGYDPNPSWTFPAGADHFGYAIEIRGLGTAARQPLTYVKQTNSASTSNATNYSGASVTGHASKLQIAAVLSAKAGGSVGPSGVRYGTGNDFVQIGSDVVLGDLTLTLWRGMFGSDTTGTFQVLHALTQDGCAWSVAEFTGMDTGGTAGSAALVQSAGATEAAGDGPLGTTLSAFGDPDNGTVLAVAQASNWNSLQWPIVTPDDGLGIIHFPVIDAGAIGVGTPSIGLLLLFRASPDTTPGVAILPVTADALVMAAEIKAA